LNNIFLKKEIMKQNKHLWLAVATTALLMSCANPVYVEKDESVNLAKYKTYSWVDLRTKENDTKNVTAFADESVRRVAMENLANKGWTETSTNPDVLLSYDVLVEKTKETQSNPVYTQPFSRVYYNPYMRRWATVYYPSQFVGYNSYEVPVREATLTLTMTDPNTDKVIWQGWTTERMENSKFATTDVEKAVKNILKKFDTK
jgi:hypothetical protein